ncbi:radical SAM protein, partial [bacterium]|nr:radical SAM protein [bacterium]
LDDLPAPAWDLFRVEDYPCPPRFMMQGPLVTLAASRGCPWDCTYCSQNALTPGVRRRDIARVVDEIETTHRERGVTNFGFVDAIFPLKAADGFAFAAMMKERGLVDRVRWGTETRCDLVSREMLAELKSAGCRFLMYGFESASRATLDAVDKRADPKQAIDVMRWSKEIGIGTYGLYMIGFPGETREMARETIRFAKALDTDVASFARVTPYPGSPMYEQHKATLGDVPAHQWNNQYRAEPGEAGWRLPGMSSEEIGALLREANLSYYLRPRLIWRHLRRGTISIGEMARGFAALAHDAAWRAREALRPRSAGVPPV